MDDSGNKNKQWQRTCNQLKDAFDAWADLSRAPQVLSADEKRLQEMKELLRDLKGKLDALSAEVDGAPARGASGQEVSSRQNPAKSEA